MATDDDDLVGEAGIGHNSKAAAADQLRSIIERVENLEAEKAEITDGIKEVYAEAKGNGFNTTIIRKVIARRKRDADAIAEEEAILDLYLSALGMK